MQSQELTNKRQGSCFTTLLAGKQNKLVQGGRPACSTQLVEHHTPATLHLFKIGRLKGNHEALDANHETEKK
eukprot:409026-Pelagomonas_calceolata.AAC.2